MDKNRQPLADMSESLARASPLLAEAVPLLAEAATPSAGFPPLKDLQARQQIGKVGGDLTLAPRLSPHAAIVAKAAPDLAILTPVVAPAAAT